MITVERTGRLVRIVLDRPEHLNALDPAMLDELLDVLGALAVDEEVNGLVLTGRGRLFSAGVDLSSPFFMEDLDDEGDYTGKRLLDRQHRVITALFELPFVTVAGVNGHAVGGGGFGLAMACDLRVAVAGARFWMVPAALAVVQDFGLGWLVQRQIGTSRTLQMATLGTRVEASTAAEWGLVNEVVESREALDARLAEIGAQLADAGPDALRMLKLVIRNGETSALRDQLGLEAVANGLTFRSAEFGRRKAAYLRSLR
ncbi:enoyl-CoA hydratase/isomerase family protein [Pseudonocardia sp. ICBG1122]|nr:enoyl-CoA hydratase/isomerase family protein [Pseudonocardia pini]